MKRLMALAVCLVAVLVFSGMGLAGSEMGSKKSGNLAGEVVKIKGEMVDVKDSNGKVRSIHVDPNSTKKTGELKVGAWVEADVNNMGHANWIAVKGEKEE